MCGSNFYSPDTKQYELHIPEQYVTAASVMFYRNTEKELEKILVMDIHSHGQYPAFFPGLMMGMKKGYVYIWLSETWIRRITRIKSELVWQEFLEF